MNPTGPGLKCALRMMLAAGVIGLAANAVARAAADAGHGALDADDAHCPGAPAEDARCNARQAPPRGAPDHHQHSANHPHGHHDDGHPGEHHHDRSHHHDAGGSVGHDHGHGQHAGHQWQVPEDARARVNPVADSAESLARGRELFQQFCILCHGREGLGDGPAAAGLNPPPPDLGVSARHHPAGELAYKIAQGRGPMPSWQKTLSDEDIWHLVNHLEQLGAPN